MNTNQEVSEKVRQKLNELKNLDLGEFLTIYKELDDFVNTKTKEGKVIDPKDGPKLKQLEDQFSIAFDAFLQLMSNYKS
jgi:hypothetical protein